MPGGVDGHVHLCQDLKTGKWSPCHEISIVP